MDEMTVYTKQNPINKEYIKSEIKEEIDFNEISDGQHLIIGSIDILDVHEENANYPYSKEIEKESNQVLSFDSEEGEGFLGFDLSKEARMNKPIKQVLSEKDDKWKSSCVTIKSCKVETSLQSLLNRIKFLKHQHYSFLSETTTFNEDQQVECWFCKQTFSEKRYLKLHLRSHSYYNSHPCSTCGLLFARKSDLEVHELTHLKITLFRCSFCSRVFRRKYFLNQHKKSHFKPRVSVICSVCNKSFKSKSSLKAHLIFHSTDKIFSCDICGHTYPTRRQLMSHSVVHSEAMPFLCLICGMRFKRKQSLVLHVRVHSNLKPYSCTTCKKTFRDKYSLKNHRLTHFNENRFICSICKKSLKSKQTLIIHHRQHSGAKPFSCMKCGKCFRQLPHLRTHERSVHSSLKQFFCSIPFCDRSFHQRSHLTSHLNAHFRLRPHKCYCGKSCSTKAHLLSHQRIHTGEKPYVCHHCGHAFNQRSSLVTHIRGKCAKKTHF